MNLQINKEMVKIKTQNKIFKNNHTPVALCVHTLQSVSHASFSVLMTTLMAFILDSIFAFDCFRSIELLSSRVLSFKENKKYI